MRVLTQNLWGVRGAWELRRKVIQQGLAELKPDVVSLQEAIKTPDVDSAADVLGKGFNVVFQSHPEPDGQTAAIASREKSVNPCSQRQVALSTRNLQPRTRQRRHRNQKGPPRPIETGRHRM